MSVKLYPPIINGVLPAFYLEYDNSGQVKTGGKLVIPFSMNSAVSEIQVKGFSLRLRTTSSGSYVLPPIYSNVYSINNSTYGEVTFSFSSTQAKALTEGQYYKIQIAYCATQLKDEAGNVSGEDIGYYSTVGVAKCISKPTVTIRNLVFENINAFNNEYLGFYDLSNCKDHTEKVYSYEFKIYDPQDNIFYTSGEKLHQSSYDVDYTTSIDRIQINDFASTDIIYSIEYTVTTLNGLVISSPKYKISNQYLVAPNGNITIKPVADQDHGFINVHFLGEIDPQHSYYYTLNTDLLNQLELDNNDEPLKDGSGFTILTKTNDVLSNYPSRNDKLDFLNTHNLYKFYSYYFDKFFYTYLGSRMTSFIEIQGKYYNRSDLQVYLEMNIDIPSEALITLDYYEKILSGKDILKSLSYQYVEDNFIDINKKIIIGTTEREKRYFGSYLLSRASNEDNYTTWLNIARFRMDDQIPSEFSIKDVTVEHGRKYKYALQQYNIWGLYSARIISEEFEASFEDIFLYDGEHSLRIRYNPTVDSFKTTILEQKTDTIGGKYPFITRNGATYYKEFPIGGLLAQEIDDMHYFVNPYWDNTHRHSSGTNLQYNRDKDKYIIEGQPDNVLWNSHDFSDTTIGLERNFKLHVLEWLNNGKPKLFKSPYEGNYIIRLMNVSLTPVKELGRMLHSFTSQAYEIAECTYDNLVAFGFMKLSTPTDLISLQKTYDLRDKTLRNNDGDVVIAFEHGVQSFTVQDLMPGDIIYLQFSDQDEELPIMIGITGSYTYEGVNNNLIKIRVKQPTDHDLNGMLNCFYTGMRITDFDSITNMMLKTVISQQYIGVSPWMEKLKRIDWERENNAGSYQNIISNSQYKELQNYNFRTYLDRTVTPAGESDYSIYTTNANYYYPSSNFAKLTRSFDPGELLDRINLTINQGNKFKTELLNMEMMRFRERPLIPVYTQSKHRSGFYTPGEHLTLLEKKKFNSVTKQVQNSDGVWETVDILLCSTTPFGTPHPIDELQEYEMLDPFCIYQVFEYHAEKDNENNYKLENWQPIVSSSLTSYYDPYYKTWLSTEYDPTVKLNYKWVQVVLLENEIIGYCTLKQLQRYQTYNASLLGKYWGNNNKKIKFTLSETELYSLALEPDIELGYTIPIYGFTEVSQKLIERNRIHQINKGKKERGEYIDQAINENEMFDYQLEEPWKETINSSLLTIDHYYYIVDNNIYSIKENKYDFFEKINNQYFAIGVETIIPNKIYWVKQYDIELNMTTEKMVEYTNIDLMNSYHIGNGVIAELTFQLRVIDYYTEIYDKDVLAAKERYLNAKNFYTELMKTYNIIAKAKSDMNMNQAFVKLYQRLIFGNKKQIEPLTTEDINTIKNTLNIQLSKEALKLQSLYKIYTINESYNKEVLDLLVEYKKYYSEKERLRAFYNVEIYYYIEEFLTDTVDGYYIIDKRDFLDDSIDKQFYIIDTNSVNENTPEEDISVYRFKDYASGNVYFYKVNKTVYINSDYFIAHPTAQEEQLMILYNINAKENEPTFTVINKEDLISTGNELYLLQKQEEPAYISYTTLLNADELAAQKIEEYFIQASIIGNDKIIGYCSVEDFQNFKDNYIKLFDLNNFTEYEYYIFDNFEDSLQLPGEEIYFTEEILDFIKLIDDLEENEKEIYNIPVYSRYKVLYEETEINDILNNNPIEGVNDKYQNLSYELDNIFKNINETQTQVDNAELTYINAYINMQNAINSYNQDVYNDWCARALDELFNKNSDYYANLYKGKTTFIPYLSSQIHVGNNISDFFLGYCSDASAFNTNLINTQNHIVYYIIIDDNKQYSIDRNILSNVSNVQTNVYKYPVYIAQYYEAIADNHFKMTEDTTFIADKTYYRFYNNIDYLKEWYNSSEDNTELLLKLKNAYQESESDSSIQIAGEKEKLQKLIFAGNELYESIGGKLPNIQNYQQIINDQEHDISLDNYFEELIAVQMGQVVLEFYALYNCLKQIIEKLQDREIINFMTKEEFQFIVNNCGNLINKYNLIYNQIIDNGNFKRTNDDIAGFADVSKFIFYLRTNYTQLFNSIQNEDNIYQMEDLALLSNYENDEKYLSQNITIQHNEITLSYCNYDNPNGALITTNIKLKKINANATLFNDISSLHIDNEEYRYDPAEYKLSYNIFANTIKGWNSQDKVTFMGTNFKNISTYFYRYQFDDIIEVIGTIPTNNRPLLFNQFIFNPLSNLLLDEHLYGTSFECNRDFFNSLTIEQKNKVLGLYNTVSSTMINIITNLMGTNAEGWRASIQNKRYIKDPNTRNGLYTVLAIITGRLEDDQKSSSGKILQNLIDNAKNYLCIYNQVEQGEYELETIPGLKTKDIIFEIPFDEQMENIYLIPYTDIEPLYIAAQEDTSEHFYKEINLSNNWYQAITLNEQMLDNITKVLIDDNGDSGTLTQIGVYWEYLLTYLTKNENTHELKREGDNLLELYKKQLDVYTEKYEKYKEEADMNQDIYSNYSGSEAYNYYNLLNSDTSEEEKDAVTQQKRAAAQEYWWQFLNLLDARYTQEKERGMYT